MNEKNWTFDRKFLERASFFRWSEPLGKTIYLKKIKFFQSYGPLFSRLPARLIGSISTPGRIISGEGTRDFIGRLWRNLRYTCFTFFCYLYEKRLLFRNNFEFFRFCFRCCFFSRIVMAAEKYQGPYICFRKPHLRVFQTAVHRSLPPGKADKETRVHS